MTHCDYKINSILRQEGQVSVEATLYSGDYESVTDDFTGEVQVVYQRKQRLFRRRLVFDKGYSDETLRKVLNRALEVASTRLSLTPISEQLYTSKTTAVPIVEETI